MIILGKSPGIVQSELNPIDAAAGSEGFTVSSVLKSAGIFGNSERHHDTEGDTDVLARIELLSANVENPVSEKCCIDGLQYLAGWLEKKFHSEFPELGSHTNAKNSLDMSQWVQHLSYGVLFEPSPSFLETRKLFFQRCLGPTFRINHRITQNHHHCFDRKICDKFCNTNNFHTSEISQ
ncbi:hypothetical protein PR048_005596 [Dryococelus australis]|uniref:Transposable element P transposase-like C-terminal domain-containing protein n=1 Tax=Dryococelus australis TaxID=614101 RepID=A0ABQ9I8P4_9NEOP|nr:hypothetical protein PR048_005596 [Dryococelus australis]